MGLRLKLMIVVGAIVLLVVGVQGLFEASTNRHPTTITYDQFVQKSPGSGWYKITGGYLDLRKAFNTNHNGVHDNYVIALRGIEERPGDPVHVMVIPTDPAVNETMDNIFDMKHQGQLDEIHDFIRSNPDKIYVKTVVVGMIASGLNAGETNCTLITAKDSSIDPSFIIIDERRKPNSLLALGLLVGGIGLAAVAFLIFGGSFSNRRTAMGMYPPPQYGNQPYGQQPPPYYGGGYGQPSQPYAQPPPYGGQPAPGQSDPAPWPAPAQPYAPVAQPYPPQSSAPYAEQPSTQYPPPNTTIEHETVTTPEPSPKKSDLPPPFDPFE